MHRMWVASLVLLLPFATAQDAGFQNPDEPTPTTMYVHLNGFQDAPINTQRPAVDYVEATDVGAIGHSQGCFETPGTTLASRTQHTSYGFSSPGYVNYDIDDGGKPRYHNERGISFDVELDPSQPVRFQWFLEGQFTSNSLDPDPNQLPAVVPQVIVRATIREGDDISVGAEAYNQGPIIAQGQTEPLLLAGPATPDQEGLTYHPYDGRHLYAFDFPLDIEQDVIREQESFNLRVDLFMENGVCEDVHQGDYLMLDFVRHHTSDAFRPRFTWDVLNPLRIESLHPQFIGDEMVVHATVNSPWGNYDVLGDGGDAGSPPVLSIDGPSKPLGLQLLAHDVVIYGHDHHTEAVALAWGWPTVAENAKAGTYVVSLETRNDQETATAIATASFVLGADGRPTSVNSCRGDDCGEERLPVQEAAKDAPGAGWLLAPLLFAAVALRRAKD